MAERLLDCNPDLALRCHSEHANEVLNQLHTRADLIVTVDLPGPDACKAILMDTLERITKVYPKVAALKNSPVIAKAARQ